MPHVRYSLSGALFPCTTLLRVLSAAALFLAIPNWPARAEEALHPDPSDVLQATTRLYSGLHSLQVKVRLESPVVPDGPKVEFFPCFDGGPFPIGTLQEGTFVQELEWRLLRNQALRLRISHPGHRGASYAFLPQAKLYQLYDNGRVGRLPGPPAWPIQRVGNADGTWSFEDYAFGAWSKILDLPFKLFVASHPATILAAEQVEYLRHEGQAGRSCHVLRFAVAHTALRAARPDRKFRSAVWTLWIDQETSVIHRADLREEWQITRQEADGNPVVAVLEVREFYRDQRLNPEFTLEDFLPEPPDPVEPAEQEVEKDAAGRKPPALENRASATNNERR